MPTIATLGSIKIDIYMMDHGLPHVHVITTSGNAKVEIESLAVVAGTLRIKDRNAAIRWIGANQEFCREKWREYGGD